MMVYCKLRHNFYIDGEPICCQIYGTLESINGYSCSIFNGSNKEECENQGDDYYWINCYRKNYKVLVIKLIKINNINFKKDLIYI